jgi:hypothetical protein
MNRDFRQPIFTLLALFGLLGIMIFVFMLTGDMSQPILPLHTQEVVKLPAAPKPHAENSNFAVPVKGYSPQTPVISTALEIETGDTLEDYLEEPVQPVLQSPLTNGCYCQDGPHKAKVGYSDPATGKSATYTVDVTVLNCQVIAMDFPKLGWLDGDQFKAADINKNGGADFEDDKGRIFVIRINTR